MTEIMFGEYIFEIVALATVHGLDKMAVLQYNFTYLTYDVNTCSANWQDDHQVSQKLSQY